MNLYFIVEGRRTEKKVYPEWLKYLIPTFKPVNWAFQAKKFNYYLFDGNGFPSLLHNHLKNAIDEVNEFGVFNYLILVLDVDDSTVSNRIEEVKSFVDSNELTLTNAELIIIPQKRCIESWFLGNKKIYKTNPQNQELLKYTKFYNVKDNDPEEMGKYNGFHTHAQFHTQYCSLFLRERNIRYSKSRPNGVIEKNYLENLIDRATQTGHLKSFKTFIDFCEKVKTEIG